MPRLQYWRFKAVFCIAVKQHSSSLSALIPQQPQLPQREQQPPRSP